MAENLDPIQVEVMEAQIDREDEDVSSFINAVSRASSHPQREQMIETLSEDTQIYDDLFANLATTPDGKRAMRMKASLYQHVFNKYAVGAKKIPKLSPVKEHYKQLDLAIVDSALDAVMLDGGFAEVYERDIFPKFKWEGAPFIQIGFVDGKIEYDSPRLDEMYFDPDGIYMQRKSGSNGKKCKWAVRAVSLDSNAFEGLLRALSREDLIGKVTPGDPGETNNAVDPTSKSIEDNMRNEFIVHYGYDIGQKDPVFCIYAGGSATILLKEKGKNYKFNLHGKPILPFNIFNFSEDRRGMICQSMIGIIKDGAETLKQGLNKMMPGLGRAVNPYIFLLGDDDDRTVEEMKAFQTMSDQGYSPIIQASGEGVTMQSVAPDIQKSSMAFDTLRRIVLDELGSRLRINFRAFEEVEQTATEFVQKELQENRQVAHLNNINKDVWEWCAEFSIELQTKYGKTNDDRKLTVSVGKDDGEETFSYTVGEILAVLSEWDGHFRAVTDLKSTLSPQERRIAMDQIDGRLANLLQGLQYFTKEEAMPFVDGLFEAVMASDLQEVYPKTMIQSMVDSVIARRGAQMQQQEEMAQVEQAAGEEPLPDDMQQEIGRPSPESVLNQA